MKLPDANLFLYAYDADSPFHPAASNWVEEVLSGVETVALSWTVLLAFLRLSTSPRVFREPLSVAEAFEAVSAWLAQPCTTVVHPTPRHLEVMRGLLLPLRAAGRLTSDAHLAALAVEHGADLYSCDRDFARFAGLRWVDPIA